MKRTLAAGPEVLGVLERYVLTACPIESSLPRPTLEPLFFQRNFYSISAG
jgi:hypothetical protein